MLSSSFWCAYWKVPTKHRTFYSHTLFLSILFTYFTTLKISFTMFLASEFSGMCCCTWKAHFYYRQILNTRPRRHSDLVGWDSMRSLLVLFPERHRPSKAGFSWPNWLWVLLNSAYITWRPFTHTLLSCCRARSQKSSSGQKSILRLAYLPLSLESIYLRQTP